MSRPYCPRCRGWLFFAAEDNVPRLTCLLCGRGFVPAPASPAGAKAA